MTKQINTLATLDAKHEARLNNILTNQREAVLSECREFKEKWDHVWSTHNARIPAEREAGIAMLEAHGYCRQLLERDGKNQRTAFFFIADNSDAFMAHDFRGKKTRTVRGIPSAMKPSAPRQPKAAPTAETLAAEWKAIADKHGISLKDIAAQWQKTLKAERAGFADERKAS